MNTTQTTQTTTQNSHPYLEKEYTSPEEVKNPRSFPKTLREAKNLCDLDQMRTDLSDLISNIFEKYLEDGNEEWATALSNVGADYDCYCERATRGDMRACFRSFEYLLEDLEWDYSDNEEEVSAFIELCTED